MSASALPTFRIPDRTSIPPAQPLHPVRVSPDSPALEVMTDLTEVRAATVEPEVSLDDAEQRMIHQGVRLLFVVASFPGVVGLVAATDLRGEAPMRVVQQRGVVHDELRVADVMTPLSNLDVVDFGVLAGARVENVIETFRRLGRRHLLVVQGSQTGARIRGVLSLTQLERQLGYSIDSVELATSFAEIQRVLS